MIFRIPSIDEPLDQGDILDDCPGAVVNAYVVGGASQSKVALELHRCIILTQTCDIANTKTDLIVVSSVFDAQNLVDTGIMKAVDVKGPIRAGRTFGLYFLPAFDEAAMGELIVDFRRLHSVPVQIMKSLVPAGKRRARLLTPYREHLAKHFADTYSRIGLPQPYETF